MKGTMRRATNEVKCAVMAFVIVFGYEVGTMFVTAVLCGGIAWVLWRAIGCNYLAVFIPVGAVWFVGYLGVGIPFFGAFEDEWLEPRVRDWLVKWGVPWEEQ